MGVAQRICVFVLVLACSGPTAHAHLGLVVPTSRYGPDVLKEGPCGRAGGARSDQVTPLEPGSTVELVWDEYVDHPGHFRVSFDPEGDDDFVDPPCLAGCDSRTPEIELYSNDQVLVDGIADTPSGGESRLTVTLPDIECERCTLQVIQVMYDKPPYTLPGNDLYYQCADLVLRRSGGESSGGGDGGQGPMPVDAGASPGTAADGSPSAGDAGPTAGDAAPSTSADGGPGTVGGACAVTRTGWTPVPALPVLLLMLMAHVLRRRGRPLFPDT